MQNSVTAHTLKDLEKALPSIASINGMQVKDYLQALSDEGKIRVEKIGSGNWYWSFPSEEKKGKQMILDDLEAEQATLAARVRETQRQITAAELAREENHADDGLDRRGLTQMLLNLQDDVRSLKSELATYSADDPMELLKKKEEIQRKKRRLEIHTDNIQALEQHYICLTGDRDGLRAIQQHVYEDDYCEEAGGLQDFVLDEF